MTQAIAGVVPSETREAVIMTVWPSMARFSLGRSIGSLCGIQSGFFKSLSFGRMLALFTIPVALPLYFIALAPGIARRYTLTNRRLIVQHGLSGVDERWVDLEQFDSIDVEILPGQEWFHAGELIFRKGKTETFRISGVVRPETFRHTCLKAQQAHVSVKAARSRQVAGSR